MSAPDTRVVPCEELCPNPDQPRLDFPQESIERMAASILAIGQLQPVLVTENPDPDGPSFRIIDGELRWRCLQGLGKSVLILVTDLPTESAALEQALTANIARADLNAVEKAKGVQLLIQRSGLTAKEVAARVGLQPGTISKLLRLLDLPEELQQQVADGRLSAAKGYQIARAGQERCDELAEAARKGASREELADLARPRGAAGGNGRRGAPRYVARLARDISVTVQGLASPSIDAFGDVLEQLAKRVRKQRGGPLSLEVFLRTLRDEAEHAGGAE